MDKKTCWTCGFVNKKKKICNITRAAVTKIGGCRKWREISGGKVK